MRALYLIFILLTVSPVFGQKNYFVSYENQGYQQFIKHPKTEFKDSLSAVKYIVGLQKSAIDKGYLLASIDSISYPEKHHSHVYFHLGDRFTSCHLHMEDEELDFVRKHSRINEKLISSIPFTPREVQNTLSNIHETFINNGYPFAAIELTDQRITSSSLEAKISIHRGTLNRWQKIHIRGDSSLSVKYVSNLLGINVGDLYNDGQLHQISNRIEQVPFLSEIKPHELLFTKDGCELYLYIKSTPVSSVNGVVGFQPNPNTDRLLITGDIKLKLLNVLKRGELIDLRWQSIQEGTQSLKSRLNYPFLFNTPFGIDGTFDLYKRDTSFLELNSSIGIQYFLNRGNYLKAFYKNISSSVLEGGKNNPTFNKLGNVSSNNYGVAYVSQKVDYLPNPSKGFNLMLESSVGSRKSQINDTSLTLSSVTFRGILDLEWFIPIARRHVIRIGNVTEYYSADNIFENELYRFGGLGAQRGFNEDELFSTVRTTGELEYRFLLDKNSHVFAFYDQTWYENNASTYYNDAPLGFGVGFSFSTNLGVFSISYALGKQQNNPILLSNGKIHFGYIAYF